METSSPAGATRPYARAMMAAGALLGLTLAGFAILEPAPAEEAALPNDAAAVVNGVPVSRAEYVRALEAVMRDSADPLDAEARDAILDRLIEQELLVQRATELGFDQRDRMVRNTMITAMVQSIVQEAESVEPTPAEIAAFYERHADYFAFTGRIDLRQVWVPVTNEGGEHNAREIAEAAVSRLRLGEPVEAVAAELGAEPISPLPPGLLPPNQVLAYLGPTPARRAFELKPGEVSEPVRGAAGYHVLKLVDREAGKVPPLADVEEQVRREMRRQAGEAALREYLDSLEQRAEVLRVSL